MKDAIVPLCKHNHFVPGLLEELAPPALPSDGFSCRRLPLTLQPIGGGQGKHEQGEHDMYPYGPLGFLGRMAQVPLLLGFLDAAVLDEAAVIVVIEWLQGLCDRGIRQEDRFARGPILPPIPRADDDRIDWVGLEVA